MRSHRRWYRSDFVVIPLMLGGLLAARSSLADHYRVPTASMEYSIMPGDRVLIDKTAYGLRIPFTHIELVAVGTPARGDVVVFDSPVDGRRLIKRIVAVAGDHVQLVDGRLTVNGEARGAASIETYGEKRALLNLRLGGGPDITDLTVGPGEVLALGDYRGNSLDGRHFGLIPAAQVYGKARRIYYRRGEGFVWRGI